MIPLQKNAVGVPLIVPLIGADNLPLNVSAAIQLQLTFKKPQGQTITKTASLVTNGTDGQVQYITETGFLDQPGTWLIQARIITASNDWPSQIGQFTVTDNL